MRTVARRDSEIVDGRRARAVGGLSSTVRVAAQAGDRGGRAAGVVPGALVHDGRRRVPRHRHRRQGRDGEGDVRAGRLRSRRRATGPSSGIPKARCTACTTREGRRLGTSTSPSLPMVLAALPLYDIGGYRATLLLPMAGCDRRRLRGARRVAAARVADDRAGWMAFWVIGAGVTDGRSTRSTSGSTRSAWRSWRGPSCRCSTSFANVTGPVVPLVTRSALAGLGFGAAATMRTEAFVYVVTSTRSACVGIVLLWRATFAGAARAGRGDRRSSPGFAPLRREPGARGRRPGRQMRGARTSGAASAGLSAVDVRVKEGLVTFGSPFPTIDAQG